MTRYSRIYAITEFFLEKKHKNNWKYPKGLFLIKCNLSLCSNSEDLKKSCQNILRSASFKLHDNINAVVSKRTEDLKIGRNEYFHALKDNVCQMTHSQIFVKESKMKTRAYPLLQFRDKI